MRCSGCRFWTRDGADGICRRDNPKPVIVVAGRVYSIVWPRLKADEWCGNFVALFPIGVNETLGDNSKSQ